MNEMKHAIEWNDVAAVKSLLANGSVDVNARIDGVFNSPLLVHAAGYGHVEIVGLLLDAGARIDDVDNFGDSACHVAAFSRRTTVGELLADRNANLTLQNELEETPISVAIYSNNGRLVMSLIDAAMAAGTPLDDRTICRAAAVSPDVIRFLLFKRRIDLGAMRDNRGCTPLHQAVVFSTDASVFKVLVSVAGVDIDAREATGRTAAHFAVDSRVVGALARVIATGANLDLADKHGDTPLHNCRFHSTDEIAYLLLAAGANVHARHNRGRTPCHNASELCRIWLPVLMAFGGNLDEPDNEGITPRQLLKSAPPTTEEIETARRRVLNVPLSVVRERAFEVCVGLQSRGLDALCLCEILLHSCGLVAPLIAFHRWWQIATTIKYFRGSKH